jgi:hypothetical protein
MNVGVPVLKMNVYNQHRVDEKLQSCAILMKDRDMAEKVAESDRNGSGRSSY